MNEDVGFGDTEYAMEILLHRPKFQDGILALREKWHIPADGFRDNPANNAWREQLTANDTEDYEDDIFVLLQTLGLSERWQQGVSMYTQTNNPFMLRVQSSSGTKFKHDGATLGKDAYEYRNARSVWIRVYADSTEREILDEFKNAKELFGPPLKKKQKPKDVKRDLEVLRRHRNGDKNKDIADWLNDNYATPEQAFNTDSVAKIIERMKQKLE